MATAPPAKAEISAPFPNPSNAVARTGFGKLWETLFGTGGLLGSTGNVADARAALGIGSTISGRQRLINGSFAVNQRAVSGSVVLAAGVYGHDRWKAGASGCSYTFATTAGVTTLTITAGSLVQVVEDRNIEAGAHVASWTGTATARLNNSGAYAATPVSGTLTGGASAYLEFSTGTLSNVQLEPGTVATAVERRSYAAELALCQRYFTTSYDSVAAGTAAAAANRRVAVSTSSTTPGVQFQVSYPVTMRAAPTITFYNPSTGAAGTMRNETAGTDLAIGTFGTPGKDFFAAFNSAAAATVQNIYAMHFTANAEL